MPRMFFLFIFSISILFASDFQASYEATITSDQSALVENCVSAISGHLHFNPSDIIAKGKQSINYQKSYISLLNGSSDLIDSLGYLEDYMFSGWGSLKHLISKITYENNNKKNRRYINIFEPNGIKLTYILPVIKKKKNQTREDHERNKQLTRQLELSGDLNIVNCRQSTSGRTNLRNNTVYRQGEHDLEIHTADGKVRHYYRREAADSDYHLSWEKLPNGNTLEYELQNLTKLKSITSKSPTGRIYSWVKINYLEETRKINKKEKEIVTKISINTNNNKNTEFEFAKDKEAADNKSFLRAIRLNNEQHNVQYHNKTQNFLLQNYLFPKQRSFEVDFVSLENDSIHKVSQIKAPIGKGAEKHPICKFTYNKIPIFNKSNGITTVTDAMVNQITYHCDHKLRLTKIQRPNNAEIFTWGQSAYDRGFLKWKIFQDNSQTYKALENVYDSRGNIIEVINYGNISGKASNEIVLSNGLPTRNGVETSATKYSYTPKDLVSTEKHQNGLEIQYHYFRDKNNFDTDLPLIKFLIFDEGIKERTFYSYDSDNILIEEINDDGSGLDKEDLTNVTRRIIKKNKPRDVQPFGLTDIMEEYYWDFNECKEKLLRKEKYEYSIDCQITKKDVFGFDDIQEPKYSLVYTYDIKGNLLSETEPLGRKAEYKYDENSNKTSEKDFSGKKTYFFYDYCNRLIKQEIINEDKKYTNEYEYDLKSNKILEKNIRGEITKYEHDIFGNVIKEEFLSNVETTLGERNPLVQFYKYDAFSRQVEKTDPLGKTTKTEYNIFDKPTLIIHPDGTKEENIYNLDGTLNAYINQENTQTKYEYDYKQRITSKKIYSPKSTLLQEEVFEYNAFDLISKTDTAGNITKYTYDGAGRKIKEDFFSKKGQVLSKEELFYDSLGFVEKKIASDYLVTIYIRDDVGRVKEKLKQNINGSLLSQIKHEYDDADNKKEIISYAIIIEEENGDKVKNSKKVVEERFYDIFGRLIKTIDPNGNETNINYDDFYTNSQKETVKQKTIENALHQKTITTYDILDREKTIEQTNPQGKTVAFEEKFYDLNSNLTRQVSSIYNNSKNIPKEVTTFWKYDSMNRLILLTEAYGTQDEKTTEYTYKNSKIHTMTKPDKTILKYSYDYLGNNTKLKSVNNIIDQKDVNLKNKSVHYKFTYNKLNQLIEAEDLKTENKTVRKFDAKNNLLEEHQESSLVIKNEYDSLDNKIKCSFPDNSFVTYQYNPINLIKVVRTQSNGKVYEHEYLEYDLSQNLIKERMIMNSGDINYEIDKMGRISSLETQYHSQNIFYDEIGRISKITWNKFFNEDNEFLYDDLNQIKSEAGHFSNNYENDSHFNRLKKNESLYEINDLNEVISTDLEAFEYDKNGNLKVKKSGNDEVLFYYDDLDRLIKVEKPNDYILKFKYDPFNRRISKKVLKKTYSGWKKDFRYFLYDDQNEIGSFDQNLNQKELRILSDTDSAEIGSAIAFEIENDVYAPIYDVSGNVTSLIYNGSLYEHYRYSVFGERKIYSSGGLEKKVSQINNSWQFSSKRIDDETGYIYILWKKILLSIIR